MTTFTALVLFAAAAVVVWARPRGLRVQGALIVAAVSIVSWLVILGAIRWLLLR